MECHKHNDAIYIKAKHEKKKETKTNSLYKQMSKRINNNNNNNNNNYYYNKWENFR